MTLDEGHYYSKLLVCRNISVVSGTANQRVRQGGHKL